MYIYVYTTYKCIKGMVRGVNPIAHSDADGGIYNTHGFRCAVSN